MRRTAFVTGASRGIGKAIATQLAAHDYDLYIVCKNSGEQLYRLKNELEAKYLINVTCFVGDVSSYAFIQKCFEEIDHLDVLVNNAGISYVGLTSDMTDKDWDYIIQTNLSSAFYSSKCAIPGMVHQKSGKIINISSVWGNVGASMEVAYSASKGGLNAFTRALAKELAPSNIQVNAIACGVIDTDMNKCFSMEDIEILKGEIPADRMGTIDEVAKLVIQIINSPSYLTGQIITLDGGWQ
ncbi:MAG: SDR family NAD(P)-dependent oxidoreductase [Lachnospiraceae bacterium]|nr:SDR family NAD(P)-dependent oxidoreductase [Lachnospiraceae bacterium]